MKSDSVVVFTRFGMGHGPADLQQALAAKYLSLTLESGELPAAILFYTDGVRLACAGSPLVDILRRLEEQGVRLVLCKTCLDTYGIAGSVQAGIVGGMGDILTAMQQASRVISL